MKEELLATAINNDLLEALKKTQEYFKNVKGFGFRSVFMDEVIERNQRAINKAVK